MLFLVLMGPDYATLHPFMNRMLLYVLWVATVWSHGCSCSSSSTTCQSVLVLHIVTTRFHASVTWWNQPLLALRYRSIFGRVPVVDSDMARKAVTDIVVLFA